MLDLVAEDHLHKARDRFVDTIDERAIRWLASSHHGNDDCHFFRPPARGSFNMCYFVRFQDGESWVVRIPLEPYLAFEARRKVEREVVTMQ